MPIIVALGGAIPVNITHVRAWQPVYFETFECQLGSDVCFASKDCYFVACRLRQAIRIAKGEPHLVYPSWLRSLKVATNAEKGKALSLRRPPTLNSP